MSIENPIFVDEVIIDPPEGFILCGECFEYFDKDYICRYCKGELKKPKNQERKFSEKSIALKDDFFRKNEVDHIDYSVLLYSEKKTYKLVIPTFTPLSVKRMFKNNYEKMSKHVPEHCVPDIYKYIKNKLYPLFEEYKKYLHLQYPSKNRQYVNLNEKVKKFIKKTSSDFMLEKHARKRLSIEFEKYKKPNYSRSLGVSFTKDEYFKIKDFFEKHPNLDQRKVFHDILMKYMNELIEKSF